MTEQDLRCLPLAAIVMIALAAVLSAVPAAAQQSIDEALATAYERLKADPSLQDEQARHRMLMEMADQYSQYAEAAFQAAQDLQTYAAKVRATGLMFRTPLDKVRQFDKGLKRFTEHPAFKNFQKYAALKGQASAVVGLGDRLSTTLDNPNLPPGARNSLLALQSLGAGLEQLGNIPLAGPMLEGYGQVLSGLTDTMNGLAGKATATVKAGVFSRAEEQTVLKGLDLKHQYVKTPLWHRGVPLVHEYPFAAGTERYYLQMPSGTWVGIADYDALVSIAADHYLTTKKNPDAQTLWRILNDPEEQDSLRFRAELELEFRRVEEVLGDLPGVDRRTRYSLYSETRERIQNWHKSLALPLEYTALDRLIRIEVANPGGVARALRARVLRAYPGFGQYLASLDQDPQTLEFDALVARFGDYRGGESLGSGLVDNDKLDDQLSPRPNPRDPVAVRQWERESIAKLEQLRESDSLREQNKQMYLAARARGGGLLGKAGEMPCTKCGKATFHYWFSDRWSCSICETCTMPHQVLKRPDGFTFYEFAQQRQRLYDDKIGAIRAETRRVLEGGNWER